MKRSLAILTALAITAPVLASSHREAPAITATPKVDATDFYMFKSYEPGRAEFVTFVANYLPLQDPYGGPNYFTLDPAARYEIKIDNDGDALEDWTFRFEVEVDDLGVALDIGPAGDTRSVRVPLINVGPIAAGDTGALNRRETYTVGVVRGAAPFGLGTVSSVTNAANGQPVFEKPVDNIGTKSIPDYPAYAAAHLYDVEIPDCATPGRVFVGQRKDPFVVNLGETFDLVNLNPLGAAGGASDDLADKNVTSLVLEVHQDCLRAPGGDVIGAWTTASLPMGAGEIESTGSDLLDQALAAAGDGAAAYRQVSRLGSPLVNEVVIGVGDKDRFNASHPVNDGQFLDYVTHPTLPTLLEVLFGVQAPTLYPRTDLVAAFLTGVDGLNQTATPSEMLRLNLAIDPTPAAMQEPLGVLAGDLAGFPNGRRPGDDVVDIALRVVMGVLLPTTDAPDGALPYTDGALVDAGFFDTTFPYLVTPIPGSPSTTALQQSDRSNASPRSVTRGRRGQSRRIDENQ